VLRFVAMVLGFPSIGLPVGLSRDRAASANESIASIVLIKNALANSAVKSHVRDGAIRERTEQIEVEKLVVVLPQTFGEAELADLVAEEATWREARARVEALEI
jgi:hypothetical protein